VTDPGVPYDEEEVVLVHRSFAAFGVGRAVPGGCLEWEREALPNMEAHRTDVVQHHSDRSPGADEAQSRVQSRVRQDELPTIYRSLANELIYDFELPTIYRSLTNELIHDDAHGEDDDTPAYRSLSAGAMSGELIAGAMCGDLLEEEEDASRDMPRIYRSVANERIYDDDEGGSQAQPPMAMDT
jgi:hypothetical protein